MAWHADDEKELLPDGAIARSVCARGALCFAIEKDKEKAEIMLEHGSLLLRWRNTKSLGAQPAGHETCKTAHQSDFSHDYGVSLLHWTFDI